MSEYIVQRNSLVNVADEIRVLSGTAEELGLDEMKTCVSEANDAIDAQATTISEIAALLEGKSVGGGSGAVETCTVTLAFAYSSQKLYYTDSTGNVVETIHGTRETLTVAKNTIIFVPLRSAFENVAPTVTGGVTALVDSDGYYVAFIVTGDGTVTHNNSASGK